MCGGGCGWNVEFERGEYCAGGITELPVYGVGRTTLRISGSRFMARYTNAAYPGSFMDIEFNSLMRVSTSGLFLAFTFLFKLLFTLPLAGDSLSELSLSDSETENRAFFVGIFTFFFSLFRNFRKSSSLSLLESSSSLSLSEPSESSSELFR